MSLLGTLARATESRRVWFKFPFVPAIMIILGHRENLRQGNLIDLETKPPTPKPVDKSDALESTTKSQLMADDSDSDSDTERVVDASREGEPENWWYDMHCS